MRRKPPSNLSTRPKGGLMKGELLLLAVSSAGWTLPEQRSLSSCLSMMSGASEADKRLLEMTCWAGPV